MAWSTVVQEYKRFLLFHSLSLSAIILRCGGTFFRKVKENFVFQTLQVSPWNVRNFVWVGGDMIVWARKFHFLKHKKHFRAGLAFFFFFFFFFFWGRKFPIWNIRSFSLKSSVFQNIRKAFFRENKRNLFRVNFLVDFELSIKCSPGSPLYNFSIFCW